MGEELIWKSNSTLVSTLPGYKTVPSLRFRPQRSNLFPRWALFHLPTLFSSCFDLPWGPVYTVLKAFCSVTTVKNYFVDKDLKVKTHLTLFPYHKQKKKKQTQKLVNEREENRNMMKRFLWLFLNINKYIAIMLDLGEQEGQNHVALII